MGSDRMNYTPTYYISYFNKSDDWESFDFAPEFQVDYYTHYKYFASNGASVAPETMKLKTYDLQDRILSIETLLYDNSTAVFNKVSCDFYEYDIFGNICKYITVAYDSVTSQYTDSISTINRQHIAYQKDTLYELRIFRNQVSVGWYYEHREYNQLLNLVKYKYYYNYDSLTTNYWLGYIDSIIYFTDSFEHFRYAYDTIGSPPFLTAHGIYKVKNGLMDSSFNYGNHTGPTIHVEAYDRNANGSLIQFTEYDKDSLGVITPSLAIRQFTRDFNEKVTRLRVMGYQPTFWTQDFFFNFDSTGKILSSKFGTTESRYHYEKYDDGIVPESIVTRNEMNFQVFPIPASDKVYVLTSSGQQGKVTMCLYDLTGVCIKNEEIVVINGDKLTEINVDGIARGAYLLVILQDKQRIFSKNIIKR
jgi:hypothetical protein